jgi:histidinol-phosphate aminotransferase
MIPDFSRRKFFKNALYAAGAAGAVLQAPSAFAQAVNATAADLSVINLGANTLSIGPSQKALEAIAKYAPKAGGYAGREGGDFTDMVAAMLKVPADHIALYPGSGTPLDLVTVAFTSPEKSLVTADPTYEQSWRTAARGGANVIKIMQRKDNSHDVEAMVKADAKAGIIYICNPNNPTGGINLRKDIEFALANKPAGSVLVVDEAYIDFSDNATTAADLVNTGEDIIVLRTFSKLFGMAGLRLGYAVASPANLAKMNGASGRSQGIIALTTLGAGMASIGDAELVPTRRAMIRKNRTDTVAWLEKKGHKCTKSEANCFLVDVGSPAREFQAAMATHGVNIGRSWPGFETMPRVSVGTAEEMTRFKVAFEAVKAGKMGPIVPQARRGASLETLGLQRASMNIVPTDLWGAPGVC